MRQTKPSKSLSSIVLALLCVGLGVSLLGCRDNPQDRAAKEVHQQIGKALAQSDIVAAQRQIQSAIATHRPDGMAQDSAYLVSGHMILTQGMSRQSELNLITLPIRRSADAIAAHLIQSQQWLVEKERLDKMLELADREIAELRVLVHGTAGQAGLQERLRQTQTEREQLQRQRQGLQEQHDAIQLVLDDYQARAEALLKQADLADGDERLALQQQAFALLLERKDSYVKVQTTVNELEMMDNRIALVQTRVTLLQEDVQQTQQKISALEAAPSRQLLADQQAEIDQLLSQRQQQIFAAADAIKTGLNAYRQAATEACDLLEEAARQYQRIRSQDAGMIAAVRRGDSLTYAALACGEKMTFLREIAQRLSATLNAADTTLVQGLAERLPLGTEIAAVDLDRVMGLFNEADESYDEAMRLARRMPARSSETAAGILNSRILAVHNKMQLADALALYDLASQTQLRLEELKEQGQEFGPLFTQSETARLLESGLDYTPSLAVNVDLYFEGVRQQFTEWRRLSTPEEQAAAVEQNFVAMERLIATFGDEMARLLEPLRQEMETAKERGFTAPAAPAQPSRDAAPGAPGMPGGMFGDPNAF